MAGAGNVYGDNMSQLSRDAEKAQSVGAGEAETNVGIDGEAK